MAVLEHDPFAWLAPEITDRAAYQSHVERVKRDLKSFFTNRKCQDGDDLVSETLLRLVQKINDGTAPEMESVERKRFIFGIARNVLYEWKRQAGKHEGGLEDDVTQSPLPMPSVSLIAKECLELIRSAIHKNLAQLSEQDQEIIRQSELNPDYAPTLAKLALERGTQAAAMRKRASRARLRFRDLLKGWPRMGDLMNCLQRAV